MASRPWLLGVLVACAATDGDPRALVPLVPPTRLELHVEGPGLPESVVVLACIDALPGPPLEILGRRPRAEPGDDARLVLQLTCTDFSGRGPVSWGWQQTLSLPWGADALASPDQPLRRAFRVTLPRPGDVLARRVVVEARLLPVDLIQADTRTGGIPVAFPAARLERLVAPPSRPLGEVLAELPVEPAPAPGTGASVPWSSQPPIDVPASVTPLVGEERELFLAAAGAVHDERDAAIAELVARLPATAGSQRLAVVGALHFLTGERLGLDAWPWQRWWAARDPETDG